MGMPNKNGGLDILNDMVGPSITHGQLMELTLVQLLLKEALVMNREVLECITQVLYPMWIFRPDKLDTQ